MQEEKQDKAGHKVYPLNIAPERAKSRGNNEGNDEDKNKDYNDKDNNKDNTRGGALKILALIGSPRNGGNTDILIDCILKGSEAAGHSASKVYLYDHQIFPCIDCRRCKKDDNICPLKDGMKEIYPMMEDANLIIFGTPIYWYGPTGVMKLLIDRMRPFITSGKLKGKKGLVVSPSEEGPGCCGPLTEMFLKSFQYLGMESAGSFLARAYEKGEIRNSPEYLDQAYALGKSLR